MEDSLVRLFLRDNSVEMPLCAECVSGRGVA